VRSFETDVMGSRCARIGVVVRCVSTADSSLSLSLSLCSQLFSAENGSSTHLLAGRRRVSERGFRSAWRRLLPAAPFACARVDHSLGRPLSNPWRASEEVPSRVPSRVGSVVGPMCRGLVPNPGPRHALFIVVSAKQVRIFSRPIVPLQRAGREKTSGSCAGPVPNPGPRRSPLFVSWGVC